MATSGDGVSETCVCSCAFSCATCRSRASICSKVGSAAGFRAAWPEREGVHAAASGDGLLSVCIPSPKIYTQPVCCTDS
eukprot:5451407-Prymnesium_polylepis.1